MRTSHIGWAVAGAAVTKLSRAATRKAMHDPVGTPRLPRRARRSNGFGTMILFAAMAGALLALGDMLQEQRKRVVTRA